MQSSHQEPEVERLLNPFLFPVATDYFFTLLMTMVVGASIFAFNWLVLGQISDEFASQFIACYDQFSREGAAAVQACFTPFQQAYAGTIVLWLVLLFLGAFAIYWAMPIIKIRRSHLVPLGSDEFPEVAGYLSDLVTRIGLEAEPRFLINPLNSTVDGQVFGRLGAYSVELSAGLMAIFYKDKAIFRATILHELGHLRNKDVNKTYFALAIWYAFVGIALCPLIISLALSMIRNDSIGFEIGVMLRMIPLTALVYLMLAAVLRSREYYADLRASIWEGQNGKLLDLLGSAPAVSLPWWKKPWRLHPDPSDRRAVLIDNQSLFHLSLLTVLGAGVAGAMIMYQFEGLIVLLLPDHLDIHSGMMAAFFAGPVIAGVMVAGVWRLRFSSLFYQGMKERWTVMGWVLAAGFVMGRLLAFNAAVDLLLLLDNLPTVLNDLYFFLIWILGLAISLPLFIYWIEGTASLWLRAASDSVSLRRFYHLNWLAAGFWLSFWFGKIFLLSLIYGYGENDLLDISLDSLFMALFGWFAISLLIIITWALPMASWFWQKPATTPKKTGWAFLDQGPDLSDGGAPAELQPQRAFKTGGWTGLSFLALLALSRVVLHFSVPESIRTSPPWSNRFAETLVLVAILIQIILAVFLTVRWRPIGWAHGLMASLVTAVSMSAGSVLLIELGDCLPVFSLSSPMSCRDWFDPTLVVNYFSQFAGRGMLASLGAVLVVLIIRRVIAGRVPPEISAPRPA